MAIFHPPWLGESNHIFRQKFVHQHLLYDAKTGYRYSLVSIELFYFFKPVLWNPLALVGLRLCLNKIVLIVTYDIIVDTGTPQKKIPFKIFVIR